MQATVADAWSLAPIGELRLGERVFPVPPLTFGRFQRLIGADHSGATARLMEHDAAGFAEVAAIVVPGITEADWREHASTMTALHLFALFAEAHDWKFIADAIRLGEPLEEGEEIPSLTQVTAGLVAVGKATGYTIEGLTGMRVDGFYLLVDALREQRAPEPGGELPMGIDYANQTDGSRLLELLKRAEEAGRGE